MEPPHIVKKLISTELSLSFLPLHLFSAIMSPNKIFFQDWVTKLNINWTCSFYLSAFWKGVYYVSSLHRWILNMFDTVKARQKLQTVLLKRTSTITKIASVPTPFHRKYISSEWWKLIKRGAEETDFSLWAIQWSAQLPHKINCPALLRRECEQEQNSVIPLLCTMVNILFWNSIDISISRVFILVLNYQLLDATKGKRWARCTFSLILLSGFFIFMEEIGVMTKTRNKAIFVSR